MRPNIQTKGIGHLSYLNQYSYRFNEEFWVHGSEQCGGPHAPESGVSVALFPQVLVPFVRVFI